MSKSIQLKKGTEKYYVHPYFPIGSIYMNISNINPSTYFGGTWERLKDRFLLAVGDVYKTANATGGSSSVTLTTAQIPIHSHGLNSHKHSYNAPNATSGSTTLTSNQIPAHKHTLKYIALRSNENGGELTVQTDGNMVLYSSTTWDTNTRGVNRDKITWSIGNRSHSTSVENTGGSQGHTHSVTSTSTNSGAASGNTSNAGSGNAHNNMPPYITVYMWKRVA